MRSMSMVAAGVFSIGVAITGTPSHAGDGNMIYIKQESPAASTIGNSLSIDQSAASNSLVHGPSAELLEVLGTFSANDPQAEMLVPFSGNAAGATFGTQRGEGNQATLTIDGAGGELQLLQDTGPDQQLLPAPGTTVGNQATITASGAVLGGVIQLGESNTANLNLTGGGLPGTTGLISQRGTNLTADLTVEGGGKGQVVQIGNNNNTGQVVVSDQTTLTYTQVGDNLTPVGQTGVQVISSTNPGNISITQTGF